MKKFAALSLLIVFAFAVLVPFVHVSAQTPTDTPVVTETGETPPVEGFDWGGLISTAVTAVVILALLGLGNQQATELAKEVLRRFFVLFKDASWFSWFYKTLMPEGSKSAIYALVISYLGYHNLKLPDALSNIPQFAAIDPSLVMIFNIFFTWMASGIWHKQSKTSTWFPINATPVAELEKAK